MGGDRHGKVAAAIQMELAELVRRTVKDPRVAAAGILTITYVRMSPDLRLARVGVSFASASAEVGAEAVKALGRGAGFLRGEVGRRLNLKRAPELRFELDHTGDFALRIDAIVREDEERRARAPAAEPAAGLPASADVPDEERDGDAGPGAGDPPATGHADATDEAAAGDPGADVRDEEVR